MVTEESILLSSYVLPCPTCKLPCATLVDSVCAGEAFLDYKFAKRSGISLLRLPFPRPLFLASGNLQAFIRYYTILSMGVGAHHDLLSFFVTDLANEHPIILGIPWLAKHNPDIDWADMSLTFNKCNPQCFPRGRNRLPGTRNRQIYYQLYASVGGGYRGGGPSGNRPLS